MSKEAVGWEICGFVVVLKEYYYGNLQYEKLIKWATLKTPTPFSVFCLFLIYSHQ